MKLRMESMNYFVKIQGVAISPRYDHRSEWLRMESNDELRNTAQSPGWVVVGWSIVRYPKGFWIPWSQHVWKATSLSSPLLPFFSLFSPSPLSLLLFPFSLSPPFTSPLPPKMSIKTYLWVWIKRKKVVQSYWIGVWIVEAGSKTFSEWQECLRGAHTVATSLVMWSYWALEMQLVGIEMCCKNKIYTGFQKHSMKKRMKNIINNCFILIIMSKWEYLGYVALS